MNGVFSTNKKALAYTKNTNAFVTKPGDDFKLGSFIDYVSTLGYLVGQLYANQC